MKDVATTVYITNSPFLKVNQAVEDFVGMKVMLHDIQGEDKEVGSQHTQSHFMISNPCGRYTLKCVSVFALKLTCRRKKCVKFTVYQHSLLTTFPQGAGEGDGQDNRSKEG